MPPTGATSRPSDATARPRHAILSTRRRKARSTGSTPAATVTRPRATAPRSSTAPTKAHRRGSRPRTTASTPPSTGSTPSKTARPPAPPATPPARTASSPTNNSALSGPVRGVRELRERLEVAQALAALDPPVPLALDRRAEAELQRLVEPLVGVGQHAAEDAVDLLRCDGGERQPSGEVNVADVVDRERHREHPRVAFEQPSIEGLVVLVRLADEEGFDVQGVLAHYQPRHRRQLVRAGQLAKEGARLRLFELDLAVVERCANHVRERCDVRHRRHCFLGVTGRRRPVAGRAARRPRRRRRRAPARRSRPSRTCWHAPLRRG